VLAFLLNAAQPIGLVSDYLPVNALLRLAFSKVADPVFFDPMLALAGGVALFDIGKPVRDRYTGTVGDDNRLLAIQPDAGHSHDRLCNMALNLLWLAAFLRGGQQGHSAAIAIAFLATGTCGTAQRFRWIRCAA
jgi:hypothetical protein